MQESNRYYRGAGYHVDRHVAEDFAAQYLGENGELVNMDSDNFKSDLEAFLQSHAMVEEAYRTIGTSQLFQELRSGEVF